MSHASPEPDDQAICLDFAWRTHEYINNYIRFADTKAAFVVAWASAIIGAIYAGNLHETVMQCRIALKDVSYSTTLAVLALILLGASFLAAALSIIPRLPTRQLSGLIFWESILVHATGDLYANALERNGRRQLTRDLCVQIHTLAAVARKKYSYVRISMWLAFIGTTFGALSIALKAC